MNATRVLHQLLEAFPESCQPVGTQGFQSPVGWAEQNPADSRPFTRLLLLPVGWACKPHPAFRESLLSLCLGQGIDGNLWHRSQLLNTLGSRLRQGVDRLAKLAIERVKHRLAPGQRHRLKRVVELLEMFGQPEPPARVIVGAAQVADNFLDDLLRGQRMEIGDQQTSAEQAVVMGQRTDVPSVNLEPRYLAGKARVHDHQGAPSGVQHVHHLDALVVENAMHLEHRRLQAHPAAHQHPLVRPQTGEARLGPFTEAGVTARADAVNPVPSQAMKIGWARSVPYRPAHVRFELCRIGRMLCHPIEILLVG